MLDDIAKILEEAGRTVTYRRYADADSYSTSTGTNTRTSTDYSVKAAVREFGHRELRGLLKEGDRKVIIAGVDLDFEPEADDEIIFSNKTWRVIKSDTRYFGEEDALFILAVRGV